MARILVVDDEAWMCRMLARLLKAQHEVVAVGCVREAMLTLSEGHFDLILCDMRLGNHCGTLLQTELAERDPEQAGRIVFMSGAELDEVEGPTLQKPFDAHQLHHVVDHCLATWANAA